LTNFLVILVGLVGGYVLRKTGKVPTSASAGLNAWILTIALPAVILKYVPQIRWSPEVLFPLAAPLIVILGAWVFTRVASVFFRWSRNDRTAMFLTTGLANTSFVGFPLILAFYGASALTVGVLCDQVSFILLATVGVGAAAAAQASNHTGAPGRSLVATVAGRLLTFPPLLTFPVAILAPHFVDLSPLEPLFDALAATLAPMALFSVGLQLSFTQARRGGKALVAGLVYKLLLAPFLVLGIALALGLSGPIAKIPIFEAAMAPMITSAVVAAEYDTSPHLANAMVGIGIPVSLVTCVGWWFGLSFWT